MYAPEILKAVREDILRITGEANEGRVPLNLIENEIKVSNPYISEALEELITKNLIVASGSDIMLTSAGLHIAKGIIKKHLAIEDYFTKKRGVEAAHHTADILEHYISREIINNIKKLSTLKEESIPLTESWQDEERLITDIIFPESPLFERMVSMGILPGEKIAITGEIPNGLIVSLKGKKFALDKEIAREIKILR